MKLKCRIHEKDYDVVVGATFSEEYNETLDSGTIILDHIPKIKNLKPYDDVYIWNSDEEFNGYYNIGDKLDLSLFDDANITSTLSLTTVESPTTTTVYGKVIKMRKRGKRRAEITDFASFCDGPTSNSPYSIIDL